MKNEIKQNEQIDEIKNILLAYQPLIDIQYDAFGVIAEALVKSGFSNNSDHIAEREMLSSENKELENALKQSEDNYSRAFQRLKAQQREIEQLKVEKKQAQLDVLNKLRSRIADKESLIQSYIADGCLTIEDMYTEIDELVTELNKEDKQ